MKILLVSPYPPPEGGIASWTLRYCKYCKNHNIDLEIVNISISGRRTENLNGKRQILDELRRTIKIVSGVKRKIKKFCPDIVHINTSCEKLGSVRDYICECIAYRHGNIPVVLQCHRDVKSAISCGTSTKLLKKMFSMASVVFVLNQASKIAVDDIKVGSSILVPNFLDDSFAEGDFSVWDDVKRIIFVGHVQAEKGVLEINEVARKFPEMEFHLVGSVDKTLNIVWSQNVKLHGVQKPEKVREYLKQSDVFLFPSYSEGFSMSLLEAMAVGLPVIATDAGAGAEMIEDKGGIIIPIGNSGSIAEALEGIRSRSIREEMSEWNRKKFCLNYTTKGVMLRIVDVYEDLIKYEDSGSGIER